jgi:hypothetical protein
MRAGFFNSWQNKGDTMNGYAGKILKVNLSHRKITLLPPSNYEQWIGGHGMGSAIFFDLVKDKNIDGSVPANVVTLMTFPLYRLLRIPEEDLEVCCRKQALR